MVVTPTAAEQFLAKQGIKFRAVPSKRGPGEWNVTFSRKGGGRLKLDFYQKQEPSLKWVLGSMMLDHPSELCYTLPEEAEQYKADVLEFGRIKLFLTDYEVKMLLILEQHG